MEQQPKQPQYYYRERDNKVIKIQGSIGVYYQICAYATGHIYHSYAKTLASDLLEEMKRAEENGTEKDKFIGCDEQKFRDVQLSYYAKEKENGDKVKAYYQSQTQGGTIK